MSPMSKSEFMRCFETLNQNWRNKSKRRDILETNINWLEMKLKRCRNQGCLKSIAWECHELRIYSRGNMFSRENNVFNVLWNLDLFLQDRLSSTVKFPRQEYWSGLPFHHVMYSDNYAHPQLGGVFLLLLCLFIPSGVISPLISHRILGTYQPEEFIFQCPIFLPFHASWGYQGKSTEVACHSLLQWTTFCQNFPP